MRTTALVLVASLATAACGGSRSKPDTTTVDTGGEVEEEPVDNVVPPDRMDEIKSYLDRKRNAAARCLADAINTGKVPKNAHGHVALEFTIGTDGRAEGLKVRESSIENADVEACVMEKVQAIEFGALPQPLEWSYTFAFESM